MASLGEQAHRFLHNGGDAVAPEQVLVDLKDAHSGLLSASDTRLPFEGLRLGQPKQAEHRGEDVDEVGLVSGSACRDAVSPHGEHAPPVMVTSRLRVGNKGQGVPAYDVWRHRNASVLELDDNVGKPVEGGAVVEFFPEVHRRSKAASVTGILEAAHEFGNWLGCSRLCNDYALRGEGRGERRSVAAYQIAGCGYLVLEEPPRNEAPEAGAAEQPEARAGDLPAQAPREPEESMLSEKMVGVKRPLITTEPMVSDHEDVVGLARQFTEKGIERAKKR